MTMRLVLAGFALALLAAVGAVNAHTVSIGYENAGPGSLTFWYGSYHSYGAPELNEGSFNLVGINGNPFPSTTVPFTLNTGTKPAGLIDGTTNFYATNAGPLAPTDVDGLCGCFSWQGVTFTGLQPGQYQFTYIPIANPSAHWAPWNAQVQTNSVTITQGLLGAVTIPTLGPAALALLALAIAGIAFGRRKLI
jgi:fibronectin-binding autotransporter adhesin